MHNQVLLKRRKQQNLAGDKNTGVLQGLPEHLYLVSKPQLWGLRTMLCLWTSQAVLSFIRIMLFFDSDKVFTFPNSCTQNCYTSLELKNMRVTPLTGKRKWNSRCEKWNANNGKHSGKPEGRKGRTQSSQSDMEISSHWEEACQTAVGSIQRAT